MPYEKGGRADKLGNRFEFRWAIYQLLRVMDEKIDSIVIEAIGEDEEGVDIWINHKNGTREAQQCKGRYASKEYWDISSLKARGILEKSKIQLDRDFNNFFTLVSPLVCTMFQDLTFRARTNNSSSSDFRKYQIEEGTSDEFKQFFNGYCKAFNLDATNSDDLNRVVSYLSRSNYYQIPDSKSQKETILEKIKVLFIGDSDNIYYILENYVQEEEIWGKTIDLFVLSQYLNDKGVYLRDLAKDSRILPKINELNIEFKKLFLPIANHMYKRIEFIKCIEEINEGHSIIIHGRAGSGKSGCSQAILEYCEKAFIPCIAIKLDRRSPGGSAAKFGEELGLPCSPVICIANLAREKSAVIILDQLDALRWTQNHSRNALDVCSEIVRSVEKINSERGKKISIVLTCRTYDLENDNNIRNMINANITENKEQQKWVKLCIDEFDDELVESIVGSSYKMFSEKLKRVLRIPSNLYIWDQLDKNKEYNEFHTANELLAEWWNQIRQKSNEIGIPESEVNELKKMLIFQLERCNRLYVNEKLLNCTVQSIRYLTSAGIIAVNSGNVSFVHQSIYDYFLVENMFFRIYDKEPIADIIGEIQKQTPSKRYQVQMLLQSIGDYNIDDLIAVGEQLLNSSSIRFNIRHVFFEVLGQTTILPNRLKSFLRTMLIDTRYRYHIVDTVLRGHLLFVEFCVVEGIIDQWFSATDTKNIALDLLRSVDRTNSTIVTDKIRQLAFASFDDDQKLFRCLSFDLTNDSDEEFALRMEFYERYPGLLAAHINLQELFKKNEPHAITILEFLLRIITENKDQVSRYDREFEDKVSDIVISDWKTVIERFLPYIPVNVDAKKLVFSQWSNKYFTHKCIERTVINILKKAISKAVLDEPSYFCDRFLDKYDGNNPIVCELILYGLLELSTSFSDSALLFFCTDTQNKIFDTTSGSSNSLSMTRKIIDKHSSTCTLETFGKLEQAIYNFHEANEKELYIRRRDYNLSKEYSGMVYWPFWGIVQYELLPCLSTNRTSNRTKQLIAVLQRKGFEDSSLHMHCSGHSGSVRSPISGKENSLSDDQWRQIILNEKIVHRNNPSWKEVPEGFIESSISEFASSLIGAVSNMPKRFVDLFLKIDQKINETYIDSLFSGLSSSQNLDELSIDALEQIVLKFGYSNESYRASDICNIVKTMKKSNLPCSIITTISDIAISHCNPAEGVIDVTSKDDPTMHTLSMLYSNAINCVRGNASETIASLIWVNPDLFNSFSDAINALANDINPAVYMSSISCLRAAYNNNKEWVSSRILALFSKDYRVFGHPNSKHLPFIYSVNNTPVINDTVEKCFKSDDNELIRVGAHCMTELYFLNNAFNQVIHEISIMNKAQANGIIEMTIVYFEKEEHKETAKELLRSFFTSENDIEDSFGRIFYENRIVLERDSDFLNEMVQSKVSKKIAPAVVHYLEENAASVIDFSDIIISMSKSILDDSSNYNNQWGLLDDDLSKLIALLYDESSKCEDEEEKAISEKCLDLWDLMFEKGIGSARELSRQIMDR